MLDFITPRLPELMLRTQEHLFLTGMATIIAVCIGIPLGIYTTRSKLIRSFVFGIVGIVQTIPSLAMLAFLLALTGRIGMLPAIIALTLYALLPIIQNMATGLEGVSAEIIEASDGMGMTPMQQMRMVKLPLALPVIMAGIKTAAVISVGIATLSAFIGAGGLGDFINRGLTLADTRLILLGAVPTALMALFVSFSFSSMEWGLDKKRRRYNRFLAGTMGRYVSFAPMALLLLLGLALPLLQEDAVEGKVVHIGSKNFTEKLILAEIMAQRIESATNIRVERKFNLGGTMICHEAMLSGEIDMYPEYTGTGLLAILKVTERPPDPEKVFRKVADNYIRLFKIKWFAPLGFNNTYAVAVKREAALKNGWRRISDLREDAEHLSAGFPAEFFERGDGYPGLKEAYGFGFGSAVGLDPALMYDAVKEGQVDLITAFSTDSRISSYGLEILDDDKGFFPPYHAAPVVLQKTLDKYPEIEEAFLPLAGLIDEQAMQELNFKVDQEKRPVEEVAGEFLAAKGLQ